MQYASKAIVVGARDMDEKLVQYMLASVQESTKHTVLSICTDKASGTGLHLQNSLITFGNNVTVVCCPVVVRMFVYCA